MTTTSSACHLSDYFALQLLVCLRFYMKSDPRQGPSTTGKCMKICAASHPPNHHVTSSTAARQRGQAEMVHMAENPTFPKASPKENSTDNKLCPFLLCLLSRVSLSSSMMLVQCKLSLMSATTCSDVQHLQVEKLTPLNLQPGF